jgi:hypothetical protein
MVPSFLFSAPSSHTSKVRGYIIIELVWCTQSAPLLELSNKAESINEYLCF